MRESVRVVACHGAPPSFLLDIFGLRLFLSALLDRQDGIVRMNLGFSAHAHRAAHHLVKSANKDT